MEPEVTTPQTVDVKPHASHDHHPHSLLMFGITAAVVLATLGGGGYYLYQAKQLKSSQDTQVAQTTPTPEATATPTATPSPTPATAETKQALTNEVKDMTTEIKEAMAALKSGL